MSDTSEWAVLWRLDRVTFMPEQVRVLPVSHQYVLVEGEEHTSYRGGFFDTPEAAFKNEREEAERSIRYGTDRIQRLAKAMQRFERER